MIMKNTTKIIAWVLAWVFVLTSGSAYAVWNGMENWKGNWMWNGQWQGQMRNKWNWQGKWKMTQTKENTIEKTYSFKVEWTLSEIEIERLVLQYEDEYAAVWIYNYFYELYWLEVFKNIANSEQKHLWAIVALMEAYWLEIPKWLSEEFLEETEKLKAMWNWSLKEALEAGVLFEIRDIEDIAKTISLTQNEDIRKVMLNIGWGSFNHLRWFLTNLEKQGFTIDIDYSDFLTLDDLSQKWLKDRFIPYLNNRGIDIDETLLKTKDDKNKKWQQNKNWNSKSLWNSYWKDLSAEKRANLQKNKEAYKQEIDKKYWNQIKSIKNENLVKINEKIDQKVSEVVSDESISETAKEKALTLYMALKEYISWLIK